MIQVEKIPAALRVLVGRIIDAASEVERVDLRELAAVVGRDCDQAFKRCWNAANTIMHANGGGFVPAGKGGCYSRATTAQKVRRARRFRSAAARKLARQMLSMCAADPAQLPLAEQDSFRRAVERNTLVTGRAIALLSRRATELASSAESAALPRGK